jgi:hypothetical protein
MTYAMHDRLADEMGVDKKQKKALCHAVRAKERAESRVAFPIAADALTALFDAIDEALSTQPCDRTRRNAQAWLTSHGHPVETTFAWLDEHGGFCDCEVLANVKQHVSDALMDWKH